METKHTPGPWIVGHPYLWYGKYFLPMGLSHSLAGGRVTKQIAAIGVGREKEVSAEEQANARLIAAAPDLLTTLREIDAAPASMVNDSESLRHSIKTIQAMARSAIAKAEGR